jgi:hypothetical protein
MDAGANKRVKRTPLSREELAHVITIKKRNEQMKLLHFKKSWIYKIQNIFNMSCFFVFWEIIFCFFGPCSYTLHFSERVYPKYGIEYDANKKPIVSELKIVDVNKVMHHIVVGAFVKVPPHFSRFILGSDYLLGKSLKAGIETDNSKYRLYNATPLVLLSFFALLISFVAYISNLNHHPYSLTAINVLNGIVLLAICGL